MAQQRRAIPGTWVKPRLNPHGIYQYLVPSRCKFQVSKDPSCLTSQKVPRRSSADLHVLEAFCARMFTIVHLLSSRPLHVLSRQMSLHAKIDFGFLCERQHLYRQLNPMQLSFMRSNDQAWIPANREKGERTCLPYCRPPQCLGTFGRV